MAYPSSLDSLGNVNPGDLIDASHENLQSGAINAIEVALGTNPFGPYATVAAAIAGKLNDNYASTDSGSVNTYEVSLSLDPGTYSDGLLIRFKAAHANTGASTLEVNGHGPESILKNGGTALASGDIAAGQIIEVAFDGTNFQMLGGAVVNPMTTLGDLMYGGSSGIPTRLAGDTSNTRKFLREQSSGGVAAAPAWDTLQAGDIPTITSSKISDFDSQVNTHKVTDLTAPTSDFSMNSHKITNVTDPASAQDAATKNYVDSNITASNPMTTLGDTIYGGTSGVETRLAGNTSTTRKFLREVGNGTNAAAPAWDTLQAGDIPTITSSKISDFDSQVNTHKVTDLTAPTSDFSMNSHKITNVTDPGSAQDAATKHYVDTGIAASNPMTTLGDTIYGGSSGVETRLAGNTSTTRKFLREAGNGTNAAAPAWDTLQAGDIPSTLNATTFSGQLTSNDMLDVAAGMETVTSSKTSAYTLLATDNTIFANVSGGAFNITTPSSVNVGQRFRIYKVDSGSNAVTVVANSGQTVSGIASVSAQWQGLELVAQSSTQWICNLLPVYNASAYTAGTGLNLSSNQFSLSTPVSLANGGTNASLTAALGAIPYSTASAIALLAPTATARQMLQSGASNAPAWSTATWPDTTTAKQLLYSSANNTVAGLTTANNGTLVTDGSGTPSISSTLPSAVQANITVTESQVANLTTDLAAKVTNPMTGVGDIIRGGTSGTPTRVAGAANSVLVTNGSSVPQFSTDLPSGTTIGGATPVTSANKIEWPNLNITTQDVTMPSSSNLIVDDFLEVGSGYIFEVSSDALLDVRFPNAPSNLPVDATINGKQFVTSNGWYGTGQDGSVTISASIIDGNNDAVDYSSLLVHSGVVYTACAVFCTGTLYVFGSIDNSGLPYAVGDSSYQAYNSDGFNFGSGADPGGGATNGVGNSASDSGSSGFHLDGGRGGNGGSATNAGGTASGGSAYRNRAFGIWSNAAIYDSLAGVYYTGGGGGGGGGGSNSANATGGDGGTGGGCLAVFASKVVGNGTIAVNGADGSNGHGTSGNAGGGGGGGGGVGVAIWGSSTIIPTATAGAGGLKFNSGNNGNPGNTAGFSVYAAA